MSLRWQTGHADRKLAKRAAFWFQSAAFQLVLEIRGEVLRITAVFIQGKIYAKGHNRLGLIAIHPVRKIR